MMFWFLVCESRNAQHVIGVLQMHWMMNDDALKRLNDTSDSAFGSWSSKF